MSALSQFASGFRLFTGESLNALVNTINNLTGNGTAGPVAGTTGAFSGAVSLSGGVTQSLAANPAINGFQTVTAAGATQGNATAITGSKAIITVAATASTHGVRLPTAATGLEVLIANNGAFGAKVYPATNGKLGASSTNAAIVLAVKKANRYIALNTTQWILQVGG